MNKFSKIEGYTNNNIMPQTTRAIDISELHLEANQRNMSESVEVPAIKSTKYGN